MKLIIITAFDEAFAPVGNIAVKSLARYAQKHKIAFAAENIAPDFPHEASWAKIGFIQKYLSGYEFVLWVDADTMFVGDGDIRDKLEHRTLNISKDHNGINCGVMAWRRDGHTIGALARMSDDYFANPWFEQAALAKFVDELDVCYQPKHVFNAYPAVNDYAGDMTSETIIKHWPGMSVEERVPLMQSQWESLAP